MGTLGESRIGTLPLTGGKPLISGARACAGRRAGGAILVSITLVVAGLQARAEEPPLKFVNNIVSLGVGTQSGPGELLVRLDPPDPYKDQKDPLEFVDHKLPDRLAASVEVRAVKEITAAGSSARTWRVSLYVDQFPQQNGIERRYATLVWGAHKVEREYVLSNQPPSSLTWKITGLPAEWKLTGDRCVSFRLGTNSPRVTGLTVSGTLVEGSTKSILGTADLDLTFKEKEKKEQRPLQSELDQAASESPNSLLLCVKKDFSEKGKFQGTVNIASHQKPEGDSVTLTVYQSACWFWGALLIGLGCVLALLVKIIAPARLQRAQELLPALLLREQVVAAQKDLEGLAPNQIAKVKALKTELGGLAVVLEEKTLDGRGYLTPKVPLPWQTAPRTAEYKKFLEDTSARLSVLIVVLRHGILPAGALERPGMPANEVALIEKALNDLDLIPNAQPAPSVEQARARAIERFQKLENDLAQVRGFKAPPQPAPPPAGLSVERVLFEVQQMSLAVWLFWVVLTMGIGVAVLVFNKAEFGVPMDYLYCFLWGFGLPLAGQQLGPSSATAALGISLPKTS